MLADVAKEGQDVDCAEPFSVIHDLRGIAGRVEIQEAPELMPNADDVGFNLLAREQDALLRLAAWIADHPGAATNDRDWRMPEPLQARETHHGQQRSDVQARGRGI